MAGVPCALRDDPYKSSCPCKEQAQWAAPAAMFEEEIKCSSEDPGLSQAVEWCQERISPASLGAASLEGLPLPSCLHALHHFGLNVEMPHAVSPWHGPCQGGVSPWGHSETWPNLGIFWINNLSLQQRESYSERTSTTIKLGRMGGKWDLFYLLFQILLKRSRDSRSLFVLLSSLITML